MALASFTSVYLYNKGNAIAIALNSVLTSRIYHMSKFFKNYRITLFGQNIEFMSTMTANSYGTASNIVDNAYARCLFLYGIVALVFVIIAYCVLMRKGSRKRCFRTLD